MPVRAAAQAAARLPRVVRAVGGTAGDMSRVVPGIRVLSNQQPVAPVFRVGAQPGHMFRGVEAPRGM